MSRFITKKLPECCRYVIGCHNNLVAAGGFSLLPQVAAALFPSLVLGDEHRKHFSPIWKIFGFLMQESGYYHIQSTKPDTAGASQFVLRVLVQELVRLDLPG